MFKITNIETLGTEYTVTDQKGTVIKNIQIIPHQEILDAALGPYQESLGTFDNYLSDSVKRLEGFEEIDPWSVLWYSTSEEEIVLAEIVEYAIKHGYDKIILEYLEDLE